MKKIVKLLLYLSIAASYSIANAESKTVNLNPKNRLARVGGISYTSTSITAEETEQQVEFSTADRRAYGMGADIDGKALYVEHTHNVILGQRGTGGLRIGVAFSSR